MQQARIAAIVALTITLSGCVIAIGGDSLDSDDWKRRQGRNAEYIRHLDLGESMASIEADLGDPDFIESFRREGEVFKVLYYRTHRTHDDSTTTMDETTPLVFIDNHLVGWGESAIDKATR